MRVDLIELAQAATERDIKRAYARLLKIHRPDTDLEAFQRLREAYERALEEVRSPGRLDDPEEAAQDIPEPGAVHSGGAGEPSSSGQQPSTVHVSQPLLPADCNPDIQERLAALLEGDLNEAWETARLAGIESAFKRHLLQHCLASNDPASLDWARTNLGWLTLAQPSYLGPQETGLLASNLAAQVLGKVEQLLEQGQEIEAYRQLSTALASEWLNPLDRRSRFQAQLFDLIEDSWDWTPAFFDRVSELNGWTSERGHLPCSARRWAELEERCRANSVAASVRHHLAEPAKTATQRAAWFLFGDLTDRRRRHWADTFTPAEWQACADLEEEVARHPDLPGALERTYLTNWRDWAPRGYWRWGYFYVWAMLSFAVCLTTALSAGRTPFDLGTAGIALVVMLGLVTIPGYWLMQMWRDLSRLMAGADVAVSTWLLPERLARRGSGVLLLRHVFPSLLPASLVYLWGRPFPPLGPVLALTTVLGAVQFANVVTRGGSPARWAEQGLFHLARLLSNRRLVMVIGGLVGGLIGLIAINLIFRR